MTDTKTEHTCGPFDSRGRCVRCGRVQGIDDAPSTLGSEYPKEQARCRALEKTCGCVIRCLGNSKRELSIDYCSVHAAAPLLLDACQALVAEAEASISTLLAIANGPAGGFAHQAADRLRDSMESPNGDAIIRGRIAIKKARKP